MRTLVLLPLLVACQGKLLTLHVRDEASTVVERGTIVEALIGDLGFADDFTAMNIVDSTELRSQGVQPGDIQEVRLEVFELEAVDPAGADLSFLEEMALYVEAPDLPRVLVASATEFPEGQALVAFDLQDVDLTEYVVSESLTLDTDVTGHRPAQDTEVVARYDLAVGVTGQGLFGGDE